MSHERSFRLRFAAGFSDELLEMVRAGYAEWRERVKATIAHWSTAGIKRTEPPEYIFGDLELSQDRMAVSFKISGDPKSYGAAKLLEDGVPPELFAKIPGAIRADEEMCYENPAMGLPAGRWVPTDARR